RTEYVTASPSRSVEVNWKVTPVPTVVVWLAIVPRKGGSFFGSATKVTPNVSPVLAPLSDGVTVIDVVPVRLAGAVTRSTPLGSLATTEALLIVIGESGVPTFGLFTGVLISLVK